MDPTAPKDNPPESPQATPPAGTAPPNPWSTPAEPAASQAQPSSGSIEPGQFVAVGGQDSVPPPSPAAPVMPPTPPAATLPPLPEKPPVENSPILGATSPPAAPEPTIPDLNPQPAPSFSGQPNPTPYTPPPSGPQVQMPSSGGISKIKQLRVVIIIAGVLALVIIIAALMWFFVLKPKSNQAVNVQGSGQTDVIEPSPLPKVTQGGFGDLPQSTASSQATKSATPSAPLGR
ncbi:MAG: hypothetical protein Q7S45_03120 [Candidatus Curtissbacteria bacterium]|nr:hypothetical protein [Candidatus Curtissbacteria bacterium]